MASEATAAGRWFYQHSIFNFEYEIKNRWGKGWLWELESTVFGRIVEPALACYKGGKEAADEISGPPDDVITEISVRLQRLLGALTEFWTDRTRCTDEHYFWVGLGRCN